MYDFSGSYKSSVRFCFRLSLRRVSFPSPVKIILEMAFFRMLEIVYCGLRHNVLLFLVKVCEVLHHWLVLGTLHLLETFYRVLLIR